MRDGPFDAMDAAFINTRRMGGAFPSLLRMGSDAVSASIIGRFRSASVKKVVQGFSIEHVEHPGFQLINAGAGQASANRIRQEAKTMSE
jgi:hypothetical protein